MPITREKLLGQLIINRIPKDLCWGTPTEFIKSLTKILGVNLFINPGNDFVVVGHQVPAPEDKGRLWVRLSRSGVFQGFYMFIGGLWKRVHNYRSDEIIWMYGDSRDIPDGFQLINELSIVPSEVRNHVMTQYLTNTAASTPTNTVYSYFATIYIGAS